MKKICASGLVAFFILMIIGASSQAGKTHRQHGDVAGAIGALAGYLLLFVGLYYSARWRMKLSGHSYKVGRQTVATLLFWYAVFAVFVGLMMPLMERNTFGLTFGAAMIAIWSGVAYASGHVWCMFDTLLSSKTVAQARDISKKREKLAKKQ